MTFRRALFLSAAFACLPFVAQAQTQLSDKQAMEFRVYQKKSGFKAFAISSTGAYGYGYDARDAEAAEYLALRSCNANRKALRMKADRKAECRVVDRQGK